MKLGRAGLALSVVAGLVLTAGQALACGCEKEAMLKLHGTVSAVPPNLLQGAPRSALPAPTIDPLSPQPAADPAIQPAGQTVVPAAIPQQ
jgi:phosphopantetheinyl transferase